VHFDGYVALAGLVVGFTVGLTGMGGGAIMTPILVLFFKIQPLAAVSSDLVAAVVMKPIGGAVHLRRGTVNRPLVGWLALGSVPSAFAGVLILRQLGDGAQVQERVKWALGSALLLAVCTMVARAFLDVRRRAATQRGLRPAGRSTEALRIRPLPTVAIGALGGLVVGMTSVGSGSLIIVMLLLLYPSLKASSLVGTDLVQAVPLVCSTSSCPSPFRCWREPSPASTSAPVSQLRRRRVSSAGRSPWSSSPPGSSSSGWTPRSSASSSSWRRSPARSPGAPCGGPP
jgi:uncharacterized membrane protein YfcA